MPEVYVRGIEFIHWIQALNTPFVDLLFKTVTFLGDKTFYLFFFPAILWCVDFKLGYRLGFIVLISGYVNFSLKDLFAQPRPFELEPGLNLMAAEGFGLPSGHSQLAVTIWGTLGLVVRRAWFWVLAVAIILLIGFSRV